MTRKHKADAERTGEKLNEMALLTANIMIIVTCNIQHVKKKLSLHMPHRHTRGVEVQHHSFLTIAPDGGERKDPPRIISTECWMDPRAILDGMEKK
jgi:hypothetical protein